VKQLTEKQRTVLDFVGRYARQHGFPPTLREIGQALGLPNISAVRGHLEALEKKGYITKDPDKARSIRVVRAPSVLSWFKRKLHEFARTDEGVLHRVVYGLALATRGRRACFAGRRRAWMNEALQRRAVEHGWTLLDTRIEPDHVVLVVEVWPNHSPELVAARVRQVGSAVRRRHPNDFPQGRLWATGYAVATDLGRLDEIVAQFLSEAGGKD
jgi:REP element-mobilizing transposase RayT